MQEDAYIVELVAGLLYLPAAALLLALARRTGKLPERMLGLGFACMGGSYLFYVTPYPLGLEAYARELIVAGRITYDASCLAIAAFTRAVFRPRERWARGAVWACAGLLSGGFARGCIRGDAEGTALDDPGFWVEWTGQMLPALWLTAEGLLARQRARRRLRLGLSDPHLCNRFLLWTLFGVLQVIAGAAVLWMYIVLADAGLVTAAMDAFVGGIEIASIATIWLAFAAPTWYRRWIARRASAAATTSRA